MDPFFEQPYRIWLPCQKSKSKKDRSCKQPKSPLPLRIISDKSGRHLTSLDTVHAHHIPVKHNPSNHSKPQLPQAFSRMLWRAWTLKVMHHTCPQCSFSCSCQPKLVKQVPSSYLRASCLETKIESILINNGLRALKVLRSLTTTCEAKARRACPASPQSTLCPRLVVKAIG